MILKVPPVVPIDLLHINKDAEQRKGKKLSNSYSNGSVFDKLFDSELERYGDPETIKQEYLQNKKNR